MKPSRSGHLPINGLSLYHEVYGELGKSKTSPLLLIPGAFMATDSMKSWVSAFAGKRAVIVSVIDNLQKGAASQAVQNFNRMMGYRETEALT